MDSTDHAPNRIDQRKDSVRQAFRRKKDLLERRPAAGKGTAETIARWQGGLHCTVEEGPWKLDIDLSPNSGGEGKGPNPGVIGRGALASCLLITLCNYAAQWDIELSDLEVKVEADYDAQTMYREGPAYQGLRYIVRVESPAPEEDIRRLIDTAEAHTTYLKVFSDANRLDRTIVYHAPDSAGQ